MSCKHPMVRYEYANGEYKVLGLEFIKKNGIELEDLTNSKGSIPVKQQQIPCQKCIACRLNYSASWANRLSLELKKIPENRKWFVTLTYSPEKLHTTQGVDPETGEIYISNTLKERDMKLFWKRLRKHAEKNTHEKLRYFYCGEYGETTERAHYHAIIWNLTLDENKLEKFRLNEAYQQLWKCPELEEIWQNGHVVVGQVSWESIAYTARYIMKKQKGKYAAEYYALKGQKPEFCHMSTHPGIAREWYEEHKNKIYEYDMIALLRKNGAFKIKPPRYFDKLYDVEFPEEMERIKQHRQEVAEEALKMKLSKTTMTELELLAIEERTIQEKVQKLKRTLND